MIFSKVSRYAVEPFRMSAGAYSFVMWVLAAYQIARGDPVKKPGCSTERIEKLCWTQMAELPTLFTEHEST